MRRILSWCCCLPLLGLLSCRPASQGGQQTSSDVTLSLTRLDDGNIEYCGTDGACQELPYDGACQAVLVTIDPTTGATCEQCLLAGGVMTDPVCRATSVGCALPSAPEPDCVVCSYVNGEILFSTCSGTEPECMGDTDCLASNGLAGRCEAGTCVFGAGCTGDADCPAGLRCEPTYCTPTCYGSCVPSETDPCASLECPAGSHCEPQQDPPGVGCVADPPDCTDIDCPGGTHCEAQEVQCDATPCPPLVSCVPDAAGYCGGDGAGCAPGTRCEEVCPPCVDGEQPCQASCQAVCVPDVSETCGAVQCPPGWACQTYCPPCVNREPACAMPCFEGCRRAGLDPS